MTTAETNNQRATVEEFREQLQRVVNDALDAGIPWRTVQGELSTEESRVFQEVLKAERESDTDTEEHSQACTRRDEEKEGA